mmetsp:Transcript_12927/g.17315  ORF Transcript_12927/g.17315 Transcript_12927/m.17315 type:complete len:296 (-) Transcript_12927:125-1012(-)
MMNEERCREFLKRMNGLVIKNAEKGKENEQLASALGKYRQRAHLLSQICLFLLVTNALTLSTVWVFVTPESFAAFREGIAMKLIRREAGYSMSALRMRNAFAVLVERILYETPKALFTLLAMGTTTVIGIASIIFAFFFAIFTRLLLNFNDALAFAIWIFFTNLCFLSDDFHFHPHFFFPLGGLALQISIFILALPEITRFLKPPGRDHWLRCRRVILSRHRSLQNQDNNSTNENKSDGISPPSGQRQQQLQSPFFSKILMMQRRRTNLYPSRASTVLFFLAFLTWCLDTAIVHE